ncbi:DUF2254 domain-containing protein [Arenibaculum sp.]|uniref:DUF2254 domain-containing protein n=1 Tax=Arenibaculum sp. TaxID=2865862 RepID=UPI002E1446B8|nr:DUF2254 domain-containing protein [Arenibaculum sp.]
MFARLRTLWEMVRTGLWFVPGLLAAGAALLAWAALSFEIDLTGDGETVWWLHSGDAEDAAELLSSLLTSMITMATLALSITMVVLTLAAGQLGPRLIRSFMADRRTQLMLGFFLATIVYLILVLRAINELGGEAGGTGGTSGVSHLAVTIGTVLVLVCIFLLLFFVHHLARSIIADTVVERVGRDLDAAITAMLPDADGAGEHPALPPSLPEGGAGFGLERGGYVQAVDHTGLAECARKAGAIIELGFRPGQHLLPSGRHGRVHPASALGGDLRAAIADHVVLGSQRAAGQDLEFSVRQLVEIALRALSPGINDPFTAVAVIDRLGLSLARAMRRGAAANAWRDRDGIVRVTGPSTSFRGLVDVAFNQIRQTGEGKPAILIRLMAILAHLAEQTRHDEHRRVLADHVGLVGAAGRRSIEEPYDMAALEEQRVAALSGLREG